MPLRCVWAIEDSTLRRVANMFIELLASVSMVVTARALDTTRSRPVAARCPMSKDCVMPPAQKPMTLRSSVPAISQVTSAASRQAAT